jgi:hypothetical protein
MSKRNDNEYDIMAVEEDMKAPLVNFGRGVTPQT